MARYWLGPWVWATDTDGFSVWQAPASVQASMDLRSPVQCGTPGPTASGVGLFVTANATNLGGSYQNLGTDPTLILSGAQKSALQSLMALPNAFAAGSDSLQECIFEAFSLQADPTGLDRAMPLLPAGRNLEVWVAGQRVINRAWDANSAIGAAALDVLRRLYRRYRQESLDGLLPSLHYRKILGYWVRKYSLPYRLFQYADLPDEGDLPPTTTLTESWPTNSTTISSGQDNPWTEVLLDVEVASGQIRCASAGATIAHARCDTALSSSDNYAEIVVASPSTNTARNLGPICRYDGSADTGYAARQFGAAADPGIYRISKIVTGTATDLGSGTTQTRAGTKRITANGSTISADHAGSNVESLSDSAIATGLRGGLVVQGTNAAFFGDTWVAADLAAATGAGMLIDGGLISSKLIWGRLVG